MPVMDEFREEREALKHGTFKQKLSYFVYYYKWHVIVVAAVLFFAVSIIYQMVTQKDTVFYVAMINGMELADPEEHAASFAKYAGIDTDAYEMMFDTSMRIDLSDVNSLTEDTMTSNQKLMVYIAAQEIDLLISDELNIGSHAYGDTFYDLREILSPEQIAAYEPYFYYMDQTVAEQRREQDIFDENFDGSINFPDGRHPESMQDPIPVGLYLDDAKMLNDNFYFPGESAIVGVVGNSPHLENALKYIDFIMQE